MGVMLFTNQVIFSYREFRHVRTQVSWTDTTLELDEVSKLSDTNLELDGLSDTSLELNELSDTKDGADSAAGRNGHFSAQRKVHKKFIMGLFLTKFDQPFLQSFSSPFSTRIPRESQQMSQGRGRQRVIQQHTYFWSKVLVFVCVF